jgi:hypothetical protein
MIPDTDITNLINLLAEIKERLDVTTNTLAIQSSQLIELRAEIHDYHLDANTTRVLRNHIEMDQMESDLELLHRRVDLLKGNGNISDKVKAIVRSEMGDAVATELKKTNIDWVAVRQTAVQAATGAIVIAILWAIIRTLAGP